MLKKEPEEKPPVREEPKPGAPYGMVEVQCGGCGAMLPKKPAAYYGQSRVAGQCESCNRTHYRAGESAT